MAKNENIKNFIRFTIVIVVFLVPFVYCYVLQFYAAMACGMQLKALASHFPAYRSDHNGRNPSSLHDLLGKVKRPTRLDPSYLHCQMDKGLNMESSYVYRGDDLDAASPPFMILIYEKYPNHPIAPQGTFLRKTGHFLTFYMFAPRKRLVVFYNGSELPVTEEEFKEAIIRDNEHRKTMGLPVKKVWLDCDKAGTTDDG